MHMHIVYNVEKLNDTYLYVIIYQKRIPLHTIPTYRFLVT